MATAKKKALVADVTLVNNKQEIKAAMKAQIIGWLDAIGEDAASTAANKAPVDTGALKNSISHAVDESEQKAYIGTNIEYAIWHELGTGIYASEGGGRQGGWNYQDSEGNWHHTNGVPAKHFLQFGATAHQAEYKAMLEQALKD